MAASMGVMEGHIKEKWSFILYIIFIVASFLSFMSPPFSCFLLMSLEKLTDQEFDPGDVPPHLEDGVIFLRVRKIKRVNRSRTNVLLTNYTCENQTEREREGNKQREINC